MFREYTWTEYLASLKGCGSYGHSYASDWTDGESFDSAYRKMANGDDAYVSMANKLLDKLIDVAEGLPQREWVSSVCGAYPIVPEFLAGIPGCMRMMSPAGELSPVKIVVSTTCSGGVSKETMTKRGVAILALVLKLQAIRPVDLYVLVEGNDRGSENLFQLIRVDTKPLSVSHVCFALANVGFARALTYAHMKKHHRWNGGWPVDYYDKGYEAIVRRECGFAPTDLWIRSSFLYDDLLASDPLKWVNEQIARYGGGESMA